LSADEADGTIENKKCPISVSPLQNVPRGTFCNLKNFNAFFITLIILGTIQSIIGITQVLLQHSIGLSFLRESLISPNIPGVAKLVVHGNKYIRAYGLFPHPNILGGFLVMSITVTWLCIKLHQIHLSISQSASLDNMNCSTPASRRRSVFASRGGWNNITLQATQTIPNLSTSKASGTILLYIIIAVQLLALLLSFSKSAIIGLMIAVLYINFTFMPRKGILTSLPSKKMEAFTKWVISRIRLIILILSVILISLFLASKDLGANLNQSITERITYLNVSRGTILTSPIIGIGSGQYIWNMQTYKGQALETWQFQPVHNVFLLIWSELGIVGLALFTYFLFKLFHACLPARQVEQFKQITTIFNKSNTREKTNISSEKPECLSAGKLEGDSSILCNEYTYLSNSILLVYFKGILLSFIFIMMFDHYFWDIWQGQVMLWMILGMIAGMRRS
jgi:hypothetical protein